MAGHYVKVIVMPIMPVVVLLLLLVRMRQQQHHQCTDGSTIMKTFSCSPFWTYFNFLLVSTGFFWV